MDWAEKIENTVLTVVTGDEKVYKPLYRNSNNNTQEVDGNATPMEFNDIDGGLVLRGALGIYQFPFEFIFQGSDHMDIRDEFMESMKDRRAWAISHPHIGSKLVQFDKIRISNSGENVTVLSGNLYETIEDVYPDSGISEERATEIKLETSIGAGVVASGELNLTVSDINTVTAINDDVSAIAKLGAVTDFDLAKVNAAISNVNNKLSTIGSKPAQYMNSVAELARTPARFLDTVKNRVGVIKSAYENLKLSINGLPSLGEKKYFGEAGAFNIVAIGEANLTSIEEIAEEQGVVVEDQRIVTRKQILESINEISDIYNEHLTILGSLQSETDNKIDSYYPDAQSMLAFQTAMQAVIANLLSIAVGAQREVLFVVPEDTPFITLAFNLLGTRDNFIMQQFAENNGLGRNDVLVVPKNTEVFYYI